MTVTRCDRCHTVYAERPNVKIGNLDTTGTVLIPGKGYTAEVTARYDLCETCMKELAGFLNGGKEEENSG